MVLLLAFPRVSTQHSYLPWKFQVSLLDLLNPKTNLVKQIALKPEFGGEPPLALVSWHLYRSLYK